MEKTEYLWGIHPVREALRSQKRRFHQLAILKHPNRSRFKSIVENAQKRRINIKVVDLASLDRLTRDARHQGVAARVSPYPTLSAGTVLNRIKKAAGPQFVLILESLEDPRNLGALIRTALCVGVDVIMVPKDRAAKPSPTVSRASAGAMEHADIAMITNTAKLLEQLKELGFWVAGLDAAGDTPLYKADFTGNLALVVGGEHKGIRPLVKRACDFMVSLPVVGNVTSLNASVAGAVAMYEALRQRS